MRTSSRTRTATPRAPTGTVAARPRVIRAGAGPAEAGLLGAGLLGAGLLVTALAGCSPPEPPQPPVPTGTRRPRGRAAGRRGTGRRPPGRPHRHRALRRPRRPRRTRRGRRPAHLVGLGARQRPGRHRGAGLAEHRDAAGPGQGLDKGQASPEDQPRGTSPQEPARVPARGSAGGAEHEPGAGGSCSAVSEVAVAAGQGQQPPLLISARRSVRGSRVPPGRAEPEDEILAGAEQVVDQPVRQRVVVARTAGEVP